jgi:hypothetical protein
MHMHIRTRTLTHTHARTLSPESLHGFVGRARIPRLRNAQCLELFRGEQVTQRHACRGQLGLLQQFLPICRHLREL